jgi:protein TonB
MVNWRDSDEAAEPAAAIVIEFAPVPVAPAMPQMEIPPGPEQVMSDASPNKPTESLEEKIEEKIEQKVEAKLEQKVEEKVDSKPVEEPPPEVAPAPDPEVAVQPPQPQEVKQETPKRQDAANPAPTTSAAGDCRRLGGSGGATQGNPSQHSNGADWRRRSRLLLERNKRYPEGAIASANRRRQVSSASIGKALSTAVVRSSVRALDRGGVGAVAPRAAFPPPPANFPVIP